MCSGILAPAPALDLGSAPGAAGAPLGDDSAFDWLKSTFFDILTPGPALAPGPAQSSLGFTPAPAPGPFEGLAGGAGVLLGPSIASAAGSAPALAPGLGPVPGFAGPGLAPSGDGARQPMRPLISGGTLAVRHLSFCGPACCLAYCSQAHSMTSYRAVVSEHSCGNVSLYVGKQGYEASATAGASVGVGIPERANQGVHFERANDASAVRHFAARRRRCHGWPIVGELHAGAGRARVALVVAAFGAVGAGGHRGERCMGLLKAAAAGALPRSSRHGDGHDATAKPLREAPQGFAQRSCTSSGVTQGALLRHARCVWP